MTLSISVTWKVYKTFAVEYGTRLTASQWFRFDRPTFQYQHPGSFIRNHRQFRVNVSYCEDFRANLKPLFLNLHDRHRPLGCLVSEIFDGDYSLSANRVTVGSRPRTDYQTDHRLVHPDR